MRTFFIFFGVSLANFGKLLMLKVTFKRRLIIQLITRFLRVSGKAHSGFPKWIVSCLGKSIKEARDFRISFFQSTTLFNIEISKLFSRNTFSFKMPWTRGFQELSIILSGLNRILDCKKRHSYHEIFVASFFKLYVFGRFVDFCENKIRVALF